MSIRKECFSNNEIYHVYNRGVERRSIILDKYDSERFMLCLVEFNHIDPISSLYRHSFRKDFVKEPLVEIIAYCLNDNHFHLLVRQLKDDGISKFMQKIGTAYTMYFNKKYNRSGSLFQGKFKAKHVSLNEYLLRLGVYISRNDEVHQLRGKTSELIRRSYETSCGEKDRYNILSSGIITDQFLSIGHYKKFSNESMEDIKDNKSKQREIEEL